METCQLTTRPRALIAATQATSAVWLLPSDAAAGLRSLLRATNPGRTIEKIEGTSVIAASQCVSIKSASSSAISAEKRRLDIQYQGRTPPTSVVAVKVTAIPDVLTARLMARS